MKKIFITGVGGDIGAGIVKCIFAEMREVFLYGCDIKQYVPFFDAFEKYFIVPPYSQDEYWATLQSILLEHGITHFFPTTEPEILFANNKRDFFSSHNIRLVINNELMLRVASSKYKTAKFLADNNVCAPETYLPLNLPESLVFPLIIKPDSGCGSKHLVKASNPIELERAICDVPTPVIQECVGTEDQEYTVGVFAFKNIVRSIAFKRKLGRGGMSVYVEVVYDPLLTQIASTISHLFSAQGAFNIQLRFHENKYYVFEINPRISSTASFRHKLGFQDIIWWLQLLSGEPVGPYKEVEAGVVGIRIDDEQIFYP